MNPLACHDSVCRVLTVFGVVALSFMMVMYAMERRHRAFVVAFALGCALSSGYGFASGAWPFGCVEAVWTLVAIQRWRVGGRSQQPDGVGMER